ncbi:DNA repair protein RadA [Haematomicrobium sanguinis]|uniref:DNA repair protein RadA n=1 Tax=Haematomicrobium sanguinis TaxID=479106 RepID=UPI00094961C7|nr:DNA repair protein RadA [Haematomicrobium sanguinis]
MAKTRTSYRCIECGWSTSKWVGRCPECQAWGSVDEVNAPNLGTTASSAPVREASPIAQIDASAAAFRATGINELDRVLGGGLVPGAVILLAGEPGVGKSTLALDVAARVARLDHRVLYVTGEESASQVKLRAERIGAVAETLRVSADTDLGRALGQIEALDPHLLIVDSVQTLASAEVDGSAGGVSQVREVASALINAAKKRNTTAILVGHVTKDGSIAGPRMLEHIVDVVCHFEGDRHSRLRMLRAIKNRYGPTDELGCFDLTEEGIIGLADPSGLFLNRGEDAIPGNCVTVTLEGARPLPLEVQALMIPSPANQPRRSVNGLDAGRVAMTLAVIQKRLGMPVSTHEAYLATVGGIRVSEPAMDLAVAMSVISAGSNRPVDPRTVAFGEIGLSGEIRPVPGVGQRLREAERLGFTRAIIPAQSEDPVKGLSKFFVVERVSRLDAVVPVMMEERRGPKLEVVENTMPGYGE